MLGPVAAVKPNPEIRFADATGRPRPRRSADLELAAYQTAIFSASW